MVIELLKVQARAVKMVSGQKGTNQEKLKVLKLQTLEERGPRADMIQAFKIIHGFEKVDKHTWFHFVSVRDRVTRNNSDELNLIKPNSRLEIRKNLYSLRVVDTWSRLPYDLKRASKPEQFKRKNDEMQIDQWLESRLPNSLHEKLINTATDDQIKIFSQFLQGTQRLTYKYQVSRYIFSRLVILKARGYEYI